jgi:hypothetical protein
MTTSSTEEQCLHVLEHVKSLFKEQPYYRRAGLEKDDAGLHVALELNRATLPPEGAPKVGVIDGVRVCVLVRG